MRLEKEHLQQQPQLKLVREKLLQLKLQPPQQLLIPLGQRVLPPVPRHPQVLLLPLDQVTPVVVMVVIIITKTLLYTILNKILCLYQK